MDFQLLPDDFKPERATFVIKIKPSNKVKPKQPDLRGYVMASVDNLKKALAAAEAHPEKRVCLGVALWENRGGHDDLWVYTGSVQTSDHDPYKQTDTTQAKPKMTEQQQLWC